MTKLGSSAFTTEAELHKLPGFDPKMHKSLVVDESVEVRDGKKVVVYRTKPEITESALRRFTALNFKP